MCLGALYRLGLKGHTSLLVTSHWQGLRHIVRAKSEGYQEIQSGHVPRKLRDCLGEQLPISAMLLIHLEKV